MPTRYEEVQTGFATVYLTLASVVIALALEKLFDRLVAVAPLPPTDAAGILTWLQGGIVLVVAFAMFVMASYLVLALRWDFGILDAAAPFLLLVLLGAIITSIDHGREAAFFYIAAVGQGAGGLTVFQVLREAARNPVNDEILARSDYTWTFALGIFSSVAPLVVGVLLHTGTIGMRGASVGASVLLVSLLALLRVFSRSWWRAIQRTV
jgi:hypothetical protein